MPSDPTPGRSLATRHAVIDIIRAATLGSYGVRGFSANPLKRGLGRLGFGTPGIALELGERLAISLDLTVAYGLPVAEVARQVDSVVRHAIRHGLGREVETLSIRIEGLRLDPGSVPPAALSETPGTIKPIDLADSGSDVA